ncbi:MAG: hypothetical protein PSX81_07970 [bacterium]|nr:hypothetical protein [bacterium]
MKKIVIYLVCITIFLQLGFSALQIVVQLIQHKIQIRTAIHNGAFKANLIVFTEAQLLKAQWDGRNEFELNHQKYDLVEKQQTGTSTVYVCINDKVEKVLLKALERAAQKNKAQQNGSKKLLLFYSANCKFIYLNNRLNDEKIKQLNIRNISDGYPNLPFQPPTSLV